jgi:carboxyl-terminal processing protease
MIGLRVFGRTTKLSLAILLTALGGSAASGPPATSTEQQKLNLASFEMVWSTLRDQYWDPTMAGLNWQAIHQQFRREVEAARTTEEARAATSRMIRLLPSSHLAILPGSLYPSRTGREAANSKLSGVDRATADGPEDDDSASVGFTAEVIGSQVVVASVDAASDAAKAAIHPGWIIEAVDGQSIRELFTSLLSETENSKLLLIPRIVESWLEGPAKSIVTVSFTTPQAKGSALLLERKPQAGESFRFGNLPPEHVLFEHRRLDNGVGYIRLNVFLDPMKVMPQLESALGEFRDASGIIIDLRDNPGGLGIMAMGFAGWFISKEGLRLGTMSGRDSTLNFVINPRLHAYPGRLAVVVNGGSASTSEILAQGLQDLGRARIFGTSTAGAALPSNIIELSNGDRFQYPIAHYVSMKGRVLERNGVHPDVAVSPTIAALLDNRDLPLEAASAWCKER